MTCFSRLFRMSCLLGLCVIFAGCNYTQTRESSASAEHYDDAQFARGATRPPTPQTLYAMAKLLAAQRKYEQSQFVLRQVLRDYAGYLPAYAELARQQIETSQPDLAIATLEKGLAIVPHDRVLLNDLGMVYANDGQYARALEYFERAAIAAPRDARIQANRAMATGMLGRYDEAYDIYLSFLPPEEAHYNIGVLAEARDEMVKAQQEYAMAQKTRLTPEP